MNLTQNLASSEAMKTPFCVAALLLSTGSFLFSSPVSFIPESNGGSLLVPGNSSAYIFTQASSNQYRPADDDLFSETFTTAGPARAGILTSSTFDHAIGVGPANYPVFLGQNFNYRSDMVYLPFDLGQEFTVVVGSTLGNSRSTSYYDFHLFEADGVTPVAVSEVSAAPEPASWSLLGLSLSTLTLLRKRRQA